MSIVKKGSRRIVVDGVAYRWTVRPKPSYSQGNAWSNLTFAVQREMLGQSVLVATVGGARPDNWINVSSAVVTPALVEGAVRRALAQGWLPMQPGSPFVLTLA